MQGGRNEEALSPILRSRCQPQKTGGETTTPEPFDLAYDSVEEISLSPAGDSLINRLRKWFSVYLLATPMIWIYGFPTINGFRKRKKELVKTGTRFVVAFQKFMKVGTRPIQDAYFICSTLLAEEEFYLIALPMIIWNIDYQLGRYLTLLVCGSLIVGNMMKDVFKLPRPPRDQVWIPEMMSSIDSTAARDFGFPSTHAMNSMSNPLFTILYYYYYRSQEVGSVAMPFWAAIALGILWYLSVTLSRLYVGVHSPTDLRGGTLLGVLSAIFWYMTCDLFDDWFKNTEYLSAQIICFMIIVLLLNPQTRPLKPTFLQNVLLAGLFAGCCIGQRLHFEKVANGKSESNYLFDMGVFIEYLAGHNKVASNFIKHIMRLLLGYPVILLVREVLKHILVFFVKSVLGLDPRPKPTKVKVKAGLSQVKRGKREAYKIEKTITGWNIFAAALVKFWSYIANAIIICYICPIVFDKFAIPMSCSNSNA